MAETTNAVIATDTTGSVPLPKPPAPKPVSVPVPPIPTPKTFTAEEVKVAERIVTQPYYRLNFRTANGNIRADITKELVRRLSIDWGDLLRTIPNYRWSTAEEILEAIWAAERKNIRNAYTRTRKQVEDGIRVLLECGILEEKPH